MTLEEIKKQLNYKAQPTCKQCKHYTRIPFKDSCGNDYYRKGCEIISEILGKPFGTTYRSICDRFEK